MAVKTALNSDVKLKALQKKFEDEAGRSGLLDDYLFVTHYRSYLDQLAIMDKLKEEVKTAGLMVIVPIGQNKEKAVVNPAIAEYNRMANLANKTAASLLSMIAAKPAVHTDGEDGW